MRRAKGRGGKERRGEEKEGRREKGRGAYRDEGQTKILNTPMDGWR